MVTEKYSVGPSGEGIPYLGHLYVASERRHTFAAKPAGLWSVRAPEERLGILGIDNDKGNIATSSSNIRSAS